PSDPQHPQLTETSSSGSTHRQADQQSVKEHADAFLIELSCRPVAGGRELRKSSPGPTRATRTLAMGGPSSEPYESPDSQTAPMAGQGYRVSRPSPRPRPDIRDPDGYLIEVRQRIGLR